MMRSCLFIISFILLVNDSVADSVYESTFAFAHVYNPSTGVSERFCVNHQPGKQLATSIESAVPVELAWLSPSVNDTDICVDGSTDFTKDMIVPIKYVTRAAEKCLDDPDAFSYMNAQAKYLAKKGVQKTLLLVKRGEPVEVAPSYHKYLFSTFYNPELEETEPDTYYIYWNDFFEKLLPLAGPSKGQFTGLEVSFYKPKSSLPFDCSQLIIIGLAVFSIICGSIAGLKSLTDNDFKPYKIMESAVEEGALTDASSMNNDSSHSEREGGSVEEKNNSENVTIWHHIISVGTTLGLIVGILVAAFFFRTVFIWFFNMFVLIFGTYSIYKCLLMLYCFERTKSLSLSMICCNLLDWKFLKKKFGFIDVIAFGFAGTFCVTWFILREKFYAFWFLDTINVALCIMAISNAVGIRNLKLITMVLCGMFIYDIVMVFGTKLITTNGCSVMLQVVTGDDCSSKTSTSNKTYPIAPIEADRPELMPVLFFVPLVNDVMQSCYDMTVEREFRHIMLGLGDVIVPGYLVCFCFFVDRIKASRIPYGIVAIIGYVLGLITTFLALRLMNMAQPALIYLVPFTLIPTVVKSVIQGHFKELWNGTFKMDI
ncbi:hypothetical protein FO519_003893 [Halicephalobus sp. NKZ332]|nr:hypothetical protein FO519_003893 [Halicephalobus sp. NKZ332]